MRIRITFARQGDLRFTGNLDLQKLWERGARRAGLPLAYSQGFHPQPKISLASALPLGFASRAEVVDMRLAEILPTDTLPARLNDALPSGLRVLHVESVEDGAPALQTELEAAEYEVTIDRADLPTDFETLVEQTLRLETIPRERRGRPYNLRPLILDLRTVPQKSANQAASEPKGPHLWMRLAAREAATGRPEEVLAAIGLGDASFRIERTALVFTWGRIPK